MYVMKCELLTEQNLALLCDFVDGEESFVFHANVSQINSLSCAILMLYLRL